MEVYQIKLNTPDGMDVIRVSGVSAYGISSPDGTLWNGNPGEAVYIILRHRLGTKYRACVRADNDPDTHVTVFEQLEPNMSPMEFLGITFVMPSDNITVDFEEIGSMNEKRNNGIIEMVPIPEDLAKELSDLLIKQTIRERVLVQLVGQPDKYDEAEKLLLPIVAKIEAIKVKITREHIPTKFNDEKYVWNYNGYEIDGAAVEIIEQR